MGWMYAGLAARLRQNHVDVSAGHIDEGSRRLQVRVLGQLRTLDQIRGLPIDDTGLSLGDVAEVVYAFPSKTTSTFSTALNP